MAQAEHLGDGTYEVLAPRLVGEPALFLASIRATIGVYEVALIGFDFPIGLPCQYALNAGILDFKSGLARFGRDEWADFYEVSAHPSLRQPFYPPPTRLKGQYDRATLVRALESSTYSDLLRLCDQKTVGRRAAQSVFFTLGGAQVGRAAISGWRDVLAPAIGRVRLWPFDGDIEVLMEEPGLTVVEIYPTEAYNHLGVRIGAGTGRKKGVLLDRKEATSHLVSLFKTGPIKFSSEAKSVIEAGFESDDDFDAIMGLLSMLLIVTGQRSAGVPDVPSVRGVEGWIFGQALIA